MMRLTDNQEALYAAVQEFAQKELAPYTTELDECEGWNAKAFSHLGDLGFLGITLAQKWGGAELGCLEMTLALQALAESCASTALSVLAHSVLCANNLQENASEAQKAKVLPQLAQGKYVGGMAMTEPGAGSDAFNMQLKAVPTQNGYLLNGTKMFITNGPIADVMLVYARTGSERYDLSTFLVFQGTQGYSVGKKLKKMGMRASPTSELIFENCFVPLENRIGKENESRQHMLRNLNIERITISGIALGIGKAALKATIAYIQERHQFGKSLSQFQMVQATLANMQTAWEAAHSLVYQCAQAYDAGKRDGSLGAQAKLCSAQMATQVALDAVQLFGGYGYMKEYPVERLVRDAKLLEIGAGTNEVMKMIVAKELCGVHE